MKAKIFKGWKQKAAFAGALMTTAAVASANTGAADIASTITAEINKLIPIISSVGMAMLSIASLIFMFKTLWGVIKGR